jgi:hypothetical protein
MGTRCLTIFYEPESKQEICVLYRQYDGDPPGHGKELSDMLNRFEITEGLSGADIGNPESMKANGLPCLAARVIALFKNAPGTFYLYPGGARDMTEEYLYFVTVQDMKIRLLVQDDQLKDLFKGTAPEFARWIESQP